MSRGDIADSNTWRPTWAIPCGLGHTAPLGPRHMPDLTECSTTTWRVVTSRHTTWDSLLAGVSIHDQYICNRTPNFDAKEYRVYREDPSRCNVTGVSQRDSWLRHVCPSVCSRGTARLPLDGLLWNFLFAVFTQIYRHIPVFVKTGQNNRHFVWRSKNNYVIGIHNTDSVCCEVRIVANKRLTNINVNVTSFTRQVLKIGYLAFMEQVQETWNVPFMEQVQET